MLPSLPHDEKRALPPLWHHRGGGGAGGGTGISVQPIGILAINKNGHVELINIGVKNPIDPLEQISDILDRSPEIIAKIKALFAKDEEETAEE